MSQSYSKLKKIIEKLSVGFAERAEAYDQSDEFVEKNYAELKKHGFFSAMIPEELGGGGIGHSDMCELLRLIAHSCSSTALASSMHQHLIATNVWKWKHDNSDGSTLQKIAENNLILISTGASDWLNSSGTLEKVDGGYEMTGRKVFCSQAPAGDLLVTTSVYDDPEKGPTVLHFPLKKGDSVEVMGDWKALGMRGTGSHSIDIKNAFIPEENVVLERAKGEYHMVWNVVLTVALPLITAAYVGIAEAAVEKAIESTRKKAVEDHLSLLVGEMQNQLTVAQIALDDAISITNDFNFEPSIDTTSEILTRKTIAVNASINTVEKAMEVVGGAGYFRKNGLERLFRDVQAGKYHPLPKKKQHLFAGRLTLDLDPFNT